MAKLRAFEAIDMNDMARDAGWLEYADATGVLVSTKRTDTWYVGTFEYGGDRITGTIEAVFHLKDDDLIYEASRLDLPAKYLYFGATMNEIYARAFAGKDVLLGSQGNDMLAGRNGGDRLEGRDGDDHLRGEKGNDRLFGQDGRDRLEGGGGRDILKGGKDADRLYGNNHDDTLTGGKGADRFVFGTADGHDTITDFGTGRDVIVFRAGRSDFDDLRIRQAGDDVRIVLEDTRITLLDTDRAEIDAGDFLF